MLFSGESEIRIKQLANGDLGIKFGSDTMNDIVVKKSNISRNLMGGEARKLLAASLGECMCSTFIFLLDWAIVKYEGFESTVRVSTNKDEKGRLCVDKIELNVNLKIVETEENRKRLRRVEELFKKGCLMSRSLEKGIQTSYSIKT